MNWPTILFDPARAGSWLHDRDRSQEISGLDVEAPYQDEYPGYDDMRLFLAGVAELVDAAHDAGLFGGQAGVRVRLAADYDGVSGAYVLVNVPRPDPDGDPTGVRFASGHQEPRDLIDDPDATGPAAAVSILRAVARTAADILTRAQRTLDQPPAEPARLCGRGAYHDIHTDDPDPDDDPGDGRGEAGRADYVVITGPPGSEAAAQLAAVESGQHTYAALDDLAGIDNRAYRSVLRQHGLAG